MTEQQLNVVRELNKRIRDLEHRLQTLRLSVQNITPVIDGLPHSSQIQSRVEKIALRIVESERELAELRDRLPHEQAHLAELILCEVDDPVLQSLIVLRYVSCHSFKEVARRMMFSLRHVFKLHEKFFKECIRGHIATQNQS